MRTMCSASAPANIFPSNRPAAVRGPQPLGSPRAPAPRKPQLIPSWRQSQSTVGGGLEAAAMHRAALPPSQGSRERAGRKDRSPCGPHSTLHRDLAQLTSEMSLQGSAQLQDFCGDCRAIVLGDRPQPDFSGLECILVPVWGFLKDSSPQMTFALQLSNWPTPALC